MSSNERPPASSNTPNDNEANSDDFQELYRNPRADTTEIQIVLPPIAPNLSNNHRLPYQARINRSMSNTAIPRNQFNQIVPASSALNAMISERASRIPIPDSPNNNLLNNDTVADNGAGNDNDQPSSSNS